MSQKLVINTARIYDTGRVSMEGHIQHKLLGLNMFTTPAKVILPKGSPVAYLNGDLISNGDFVEVFHLYLSKLRNKRNIQQLIGLKSCITSLHYP